MREKSEATVQDSLTYVARCLCVVMMSFKLSSADFCRLWALPLAAVSPWSGCLSIDALPVASDVEDAGSGEAHAGDAGPWGADGSASCAENQADPLIGTWSHDTCVMVSLHVTCDDWGSSVLSMTRR